MSHVRCARAQRPLGLALRGQKSAPGFVVPGPALHAVFRARPMAPRQKSHGCNGEPLGRAPKLRALRVDQKSWGGFAPWKCVETMPRDVDENGHPTQLVGSEVCQTIHVRNHDPKGLYCAVLMSDGPGLKTSEENLKTRLAMIGRNEPSQADLAYLCNSLAIDAQNSGCLDDTSVAMIWLKFS